MSSEKQPETKKTNTNIIDIVVDGAFDMITLPFNLKRLNGENYVPLKGKDFYKNKKLNDNYVVILHKDTYAWLSYKSRKVAEGHVSEKGREGLWFEYGNYEGSKPNVVIQAEYKNGQLHGSFQEKKIISNETYTTTGAYKNGKKHGTFTSQKGRIIYEKAFYQNDELIKRYQYDDSGKLLYVDKFAQNTPESDSSAKSGIAQNTPAPDSSAKSRIAQNSVCITHSDNTLLSDLPVQNQPDRNA